MISQGRLGKKNGLGFYKHTNKCKTLDLDFLTALQLNVREEKLQLPHEEARIAERLTFLMVNEASRCLEEKIIENARAVDIGMILGTGFAPFRGGLLKYANSQCLRRVYDKLLEFTERHGQHYKPSMYLYELAKSDGSFSS